MGYIPDREAMALAWIHSAGVRQMTAYTVSTWYGHAWGVNDYFLSGAHTYAESFFLNHQALLWRLEARFPVSARVNLEEYHIEEDPQLLARLARRHGLSHRDELGLLWDRDTIAFFGDPAWDARLEFQGQQVVEQTLSEKEGILTFEVVTRGAGSWHRPPAAVLPFRVKDVRILEGAALVTENFVLLPLEGAFQKGEVRRVRFSAARKS
jgi:zinc protease